MGMSLKDDIHDAVQGFKWVINDLNADDWADSQP